MVCANAGHEFPILLRENGEYEVLRDDHSLPLAAIEGMQTKEYYLKLNPGDRIFVYTDGVPEAINDKKEQYGIVRLVNVLNENKNVAFKELLPMIRQDVADFANGEEQFDDITMLGFIFNDYLKVGNV
jgi:serine phosphatase RsbU (regulator of sigma subunit)